MNCVLCKHSIAKGEGYLPTPSDSIAQLSFMMTLMTLSLAKLKEWKKSAKRRYMEHLRLHGEPPGPRPVMIEGLLCETCMKKLEDVITEDKTYHQRFVSDKRQARANAKLVWEKLGRS